ncbi:hypothetical protein V8132_001938 [Vibrio parahaemolyticus]
MITNIVEDSIGWLEGFRIDDIPSNLPKGISVHLNNGVIGLKSRGMVGSIPLLNGDTVEIIPKIGQVNFLAMLFKAEGELDSLVKEFETFVESSIDDIESFTSIVFRCFVVCLDEILRKSPIFCRKWESRNLTYIQGRVDVLQTVENLAKGSKTPISTKIKERTLDSAENRILTEAAIRVLANLSDSSDHLKIRVIHQWLGKFERSKTITSDLNRVDRMFALGAYGGSRDYYRKALMLAKIILGASGIGINGEEAINTDATLLNSADIFEKYIRSVIANSYSESGYIVKKGDGRQTLYVDGSFSLEPDVLIERDSKVILIADAKYKIPDSKDHYQMASYLTSFGVQEGVLLAPNMTEDTIKIKEYLTESNQIIREVYLPMANLSETENFLSKLLATFDLS